MSKGIPRVEITWVDSATFDGWQSGPHGARPSVCTTVGFLVKETKKYVIIAGSISPNQMMSPLAIPKAVITKRRRLKW